MRKPIWIGLIRYDHQAKVTLHGPAPINRSSSSEVVLVQGIYISVSHEEQPGYMYLR